MLKDLVYLTSLLGCTVIDRVSRNTCFSGSSGCCQEAETHIESTLGRNLWINNQVDWRVFQSPPHALVPHPINCQELSCVRSISHGWVFPEASKTPETVRSAIACQASNCKTAWSLYGSTKCPQQKKHQSWKGKGLPAHHIVTRPWKFYLSVLSLAKPGFSSLCSVPLLDLWRLRRECLRRGWSLSGISSCSRASFSTYG